MNNDHLWSAIGKILAIIGGIAGIIKIIESFTSPKGKLTASVQSVPFILPTPPKDKLSSIGGFKSLWVAVLRNSGSKSCEGAMIILPDSSIAKIDRAGLDIEFRNLKDGVIELGTIKPKEEIRIYAWNAWGHGDLAEVRLSYASGVGKIFPRADAPKFCHDIETTLPYFWSMISVGIVGGAIGLVLVLCVEWIKKPTILPQANTSITTNSSSTQITNTSSAK
jgi:hypothetical protein